MDIKNKITQLKQDLIALYLCFKEPRTPFYAKLILFLLIAYAMSPIDLIPDFIPVIGLLDDLILISLGTALAIKLIPKEIWAENKIKAGYYKKSDIKINHMFGIVIVISIWLITAYVLYRLISIAQ